MAKVRVVVTDERACGRRVEHGVYLVAGEGEPGGVLDLFTLINPPIPYPVALHRSPRLVQADAILERQPMETWWVGTSLRTEEKKNADEWAYEMFGMPVEKRVRIGDCEGVRGASEAVAVLAAAVSYDTRIPRMFRTLTERNIQELPGKAVVYYNKLHTALVNYTENQQVSDLLTAQAAVWRLAHVIPPHTIGQFVPTLSTLLYLMGLRQDASVMLRTITQQEYVL